MQEPFDELTRYDLTRQRLREALAGQVPTTVDLDGMLDAYAYWVCRGADWEASLRDHVDRALRRGADESEAERRELALLRRELAGAQGPVLDIGAGWGRLAPLYDELGLRAVYAEPETLGTRLMRRGSLSRIVRAVGEALPFGDATFPTTIIGWVLHHDGSPKVDATGILGQAARATVPGGRLLSVEPLGMGFDQEKWESLLAKAGFQVKGVERFFETTTARGETRWCALAIGTQSDLRAGEWVLWG